MTGDGRGQFTVLGCGGGELDLPTYGRRKEGRKARLRSLKNTENCSIKSVVNENCNVGSQ